MELTAKRRSDTDAFYTPGQWARLAVIIMGSVWEFPHHVQRPARRMDSVLTA